MAGGGAEGVIVGTTVGLLQDQIGTAFASRYLAAYGESSTPEVGCGTYNLVQHYAVAAAIAGGTSAP